MPNFTFCPGRERRQRLSCSFPELWYSVLEFNSRNFANIWRIERVGISAIKFEAARIHVYSDAFVDLAVRRCRVSSLMFSISTWSLSGGSVWERKYGAVNTNETAEPFLVYTSFLVIVVYCYSKISLMAKISVVICLAMTNDIEFAYLVNLPNSSGELVEKEWHKTVLHRLRTSLFNSCRLLWQRSQFLAWPVTLLTERFRCMVGREYPRIHRWLISIQELGVFALLMARMRFIWRQWLNLSWRKHSSPRCNLIILSIWYNDESADRLRMNINIL